MIQTVDDLRTRLIEAGLGKRADAITALARPGLRLKVAAETGEPMAPNSSRIGGVPHFPPEAPWPESVGGPLAFIAQIDLASALRTRGGLPLPPAGTLAFFYDAVGNPGGIDPEERSGWRVILTEPETTLHCRDYPASLSEDGRFTGRKLELISALWPPALDEWEAGLIDWSGEETDFYRDMQTALRADFGVHRLLGHPLVIQSGMQEECAISAAGLRLSATDRDSPEFRDVIAGAHSWHLLLQIDSDIGGDGTGMRWGDCGSLYWWIHDDDLAAGRFDRTLFDLRCY